MGLWIDDARWPAYGQHFAHLISDVSLAELHAFADAAGVDRRAYDGDHYDVPAAAVPAVVAAGAQLTSARHLVSLLNVSGLRFRKRRGDRPVAGRLRNALPVADVEHWVDLALAVALPPDAETMAAAVLVREGGRTLVVHHPQRGWELPGGRREPGESIAQTAAREVAEESGVALDTASLAPAGWERILPDTPTSSWLRYPQGYVAVLTATASSRALPASPCEYHSTWWDDRQLADACAHQFWWPLVVRLLGQPRSAGSAHGRDDLNEHRRDEDGRQQISDPHRLHVQQPHP